MSFRRFALRLWNSPTFTSWGSMGARTLAFVAVLPLVLKRFSAEEFTVWSLLTTIISLQMLAELGFGVTFARVIAYAMGGAEDLAIFSAQRDVNPNPKPNYELLTRILGTMRVIYGRLGHFLLVAIGIGGTCALWLPVSRTVAPAEAWIAWGFVAFTTVVSFRSNLYTCFLQGSNHIPLLRRWETAFALGGIVSSVVVLSLNGGLLPLAIANQTWTLLTAWCNRRLTRIICESRYATLPPGRVDPEVFKAIWPSAWRSAVGTAMSFGLMQLSSILVAQSRDINAANSYLLGMRIIQAINQFAMAPFYSQLPTLGRLYAARRLPELISCAARGMRLAYWTFLAPSILVGWLGSGLLTWMGSKTLFPAPEIWWLLAASLLVQRYGAMHIQMYSLSNQVIWHVANGVTGCLMLILWAIFVPRYGLIAVPAGSLAAHLAFYAWFPAKKNHHHFGLNFPIFDLRCLVGRTGGRSGYRTT